MQIIVDEYGYALRKVSERLVIRDKDRKVIQEIPFFNVDDVVIASRGVSISSDVVEHCVEQGIPIHFLSIKGDPFAKLVSPTLQATIATRRAQLRAFDDKRGIEICKHFVGVK